jgi:hypothetical protein
VIEQREVVFFEDGLHGGGQIGVPIGEFAAGFAGLAEDFEHLAREDDCRRRARRHPKSS